MTPMVMFTINGVTEIVSVTEERRENSLMQRDSFSDYIQWMKMRIGLVDGWHHLERKMVEKYH